MNQRNTKSSVSRWDTEWLRNHINDGTEGVDLLDVFDQKCHWIPTGITNLYTQLIERAGVLASQSHCIIAYKRQSPKRVSL